MCTNNNKIYLSMIKQTILLILTTPIILSGCVSNGKPTDRLTPEFDQINKNISELDQSLTQQIVSNCRQDNAKLVAQISAAISAQQSATADAVKAKPTTAQACTNNASRASKDKKLVFGGIEKILFVNEELKADARIDTGADTSSLGVFNIKRFERDGKKWVRFSLVDEEDAPVFKYPIYDTAKIKRESDEDPERRREIKMTVKVGGKKYNRQIFNLADRSHLEFQVLIGRNFLRDIAVVDVSSRYLLGGE